MNYDSIYLTSGGTNGYVFIGALQILKNYNVLKNIQTIIGCSVGSIFSLLYLLEYNPKDILKIVTSSDIENIYINNKINNENIILNLTMNLGINDGSGITRLLEIFLEYKNLDKNITLLELFNKYKKELIILVTDIKENKLEYLSYKNYPNMSVKTAIRASSSIPYIFTPISYKNKLFVDGGFISDISCKVIKDTTLILRLKSSKYYETNLEIDNIIDYSKLLFQNLLLQTQLNNDNNNYNTILYNFDYSGINFDISNNFKKKLYFFGLIKTIDFIKNKRLKIKFFKLFKQIKNKTLENKTD